MKTIKMKLAYPQEHMGHCQITYISKNDEGERLVYCLQGNFDDIRLMRCTQEGEPIQQVYLRDPISFERPTGDSKLEKLANAWIDAYEKEQKEKKERELLAEAMKIQDACNLCGLAQRFAQVLVELGDLTNGTDERNRHPVVTLWLSKLCQLNQFSVEKEVKSFDLAWKAEKFGGHEEKR